MIELAPTFFPELTYDEAWMYCVTLEHNGHKDWRMPTFLEWCNSTELLGWYENAMIHVWIVPATATEVRAVCPVRDI